MAKVGRYETKGGTLRRVRYCTPGRKQTQRRGFATKRDAELFAGTVEHSKGWGEYSRLGWSVGRSSATCFELNF